MKEQHLMPAPVRGRYSVVWKFMPEGWGEDISDAPAPGAMPYFVDGEDYERLERKERVPLKGYALLCGILISWFEPDKFMAGRERALYRFLEDMVERLRQDLAMPSVEAMILAAADRVREDHGPLLASRMLTAAIHLAPASTPVRYQLMVDVWRCLEILDDVDQGSALGFIHQVYADADLTGADPDRLELMDYMHMVALRLTAAPDDYKRFFWETASKHIHDPALRHRMFDLMEDDSPRFQDYRIGTDGGERAGGRDDRG
ncbi:MAG: hypothetical protein U5S82_15475 [Gammaproteobacteria bacterium]|nr:hypothetical protein [Gammaproteobacteria bacterium]